jgi:hypothetical protein
MKAGNLSVEGGDDLVCVHRANIAKLSIVTNTGWHTMVTRVAAALCGLVWPPYEKDSAEPIQLSLQLFDATLQRIPALSEQSNGLHVTGFVTAGLKIVDVLPELLR